MRSASHLQGKLVRPRPPSLTLQKHDLRETVSIFEPHIKGHLSWLPLRGTHSGSKRTRAR